jgi:hypothetical protein
VDEFVIHEPTQEGWAEFAQEAPAELREGGHDGVDASVPKVHVG